MFNITQFRELIIKSTLNDLIMYSENAEELLVFTCAVESEGGTFLKQENGTALGIYQMEPQTHNDIWQNYIQNKSNLSMILFSNFHFIRPSEEMLISDLRYATAMARIHYRRVLEPMPNRLKINDIWEYYKKNYNTSQGKAEKDSSIAKYEKFINQ